MSISRTFVGFVASIMATGIFSFPCAAQVYLNPYNTVPQNPYGFGPFNSFGSNPFNSGNFFQSNNMPPNRGVAPKGKGQANNNVQPNSAGRVPSTLNSSAFNPINPLAAYNGFGSPFNSPFTPYQALTSMPFVTNNPWPTVNPYIPNPYIMGGMTNPMMMNPWLQNNPMGMMNPMGMNGVGMYPMGMMNPMGMNGMGMYPMGMMNPYNSMMTNPYMSGGVMPGLVGPWQPQFGYPGMNVPATPGIFGANPFGFF